MVFLIVVTYKRIPGQRMEQPPALEYMERTLGLASMAPLLAFI